MSTTLCTWSVMLVENNSNPVCLGEEVDLMEMDGVADWIKRLDDLVTKHLARTRTQSKKFKK